MLVPPVIEVPGERPTLSLMVVGPVLVTVEPASTEKAVAVPSGGVVAAAKALFARGPPRNSAVSAATEMIRTSRRPSSERGKTGITEIPQELVDRIARRLGCSNRRNGVGRFTTRRIVHSNNTSELTRVIV